jgi:5'-deoxynucleotidase
MSHFFAYISRLRWIQRWSLMRNAIPEDVATHSWEVGTLAHVLGVIHNNQNPNNKIDAHKLATCGLYHDATEVITGDMPTPVKYHSEAMRDAYKGVEQRAEKELLNLLPTEMHEAFKNVLIEHELPEVYQRLLKAADRLSALLKCQAELRAGNKEFEHAAQEILKRLNEEQQPEVLYFLENFAPAYALSLDHLLK